jgi:hypothetical protein
MRETWLLYPKHAGMAMRINCRLIGADFGVAPKLNPFIVHHYAGIT